MDGSNQPSPVPSSASTPFPFSRVVSRIVLAGLFAIVCSVVIANSLGDERHAKAAAASGLVTMVIAIASLLPMRRRPVANAFVGFVAGMILRALASVLVAVLLVVIGRQPIEATMFAMAGVYVACLVFEVTALVRWIDETNRLNR